MAKENGLGWTTLSVDNSGGSVNAIKNDITNLSFGTPRAVQDITGVDKSAFERLLLLADMTVTLNGVFNDASNLSHDTFKTVPSTSVNRTTTLVVSGQTLAGELLYTDYSFQRSQAGELTFTAPGVLADGTVPTWA
jgi:hypothetical protein